MKVLNRLPYSGQRNTINLRGESVQVKPYQIIVWVSISLADVLDWDPRIPALPAILDTGNNFTFSIHRSQLIRWAGIRPESMRVLGSIRLGDKLMPRHDADVWLHPNVPGRLDRQPDREPFRLSLEEGIAVYPDDGPAHLPLLGLRALTENKLRTAIEGDRSEVTLRTGRTFRLFG